MRADDLRLDELVTFSEGLVSLHGRRLIIHDIHAMAQLRKDLVEAMGLERSSQILSRFGYFWGEADAAALRRIFDWDDVKEWLRAGPQFHSLQGVAKANVKSLDIDAENRLRMEIEWENCAEAEEQLIELGPSPDAGCWIHQGYASGYATFCLGRPTYFVEQTCRARGDRVCSAIGMDAELWGDEAQSIARNFQVDDIQSKIEDLTTALRKKTLELARHRKKLQEVEFLTVGDTAETRSKAFREVLEMGHRVGRFDTSVLITGESGVGKEVVARFIHQSSARRRRRFVAINCGALPETLLESELFGHRSGSFTGAVRDRPGLFEEANGGTILLDEIGDVPPSVQVKLLRVLQEKKVRRVGEDKSRDVNVRVIAATNRDLPEAVREGRFREDLLYRLRVVEIRVPPLRERPEDVLPLARHFIGRLVERLKLPRLKLHASTIPHLERYSWPGNVRELENALERAAVMTEDGWIRPEHLPLERSEPGVIAGTFGPGPVRPLVEMEREYILGVLKSLHGNRTRAARVLGISTTTLWRRLKEWGVLDDDQRL